MFVATHRLLAAMVHMSLLQGLPRRGKRVEGKSEKKVSRSKATCHCGARFDPPGPNGTRLCPNGHEDDRGTSSRRAR